MSEKVVKPENEWKRALTPEQYRVARMKGTEPAFTGQYWDSHENGIYRCACCGNDLFSSDCKYDSGTGWPSFFSPVSEQNIRKEREPDPGWGRVEVLCDRCDAHLGHVFTDGPEPTHLRYCVNSAALKFSKSE